MTIPAGRELDVLVAARVMRLAIPAPSSIREWRPIQYSTTWEGMRLVVERMRELKWLCQMQQQEDGKWEAVFMNEDWEDEIKWADSLPRAVCLAALAAVESKKENPCPTK